MRAMAGCHALRCGGVAHLFLLFLPSIILERPARLAPQYPPRCTSILPRAWLSCRKPLAGNGRGHRVAQRQECAARLLGAHRNSRIAQGAMLRSRLLPLNTEGPGQLRAWSDTWRGEAALPTEGRAWPFNISARGGDLLTRYSCPVGTEPAGPSLDVPAAGNRKARARPQHSSGALGCHVRRLASTAQGTLPIGLTRASPSSTFHLALRG
ncbi:hypothetical protein B0T25DRAFT_294697 [Lasiosphaeria hispida]|uniref:Secreted protein n=1 Tax=Lasiosphaeria hispida TaxID=260671 RepID=A0AAJ0MBP6_9PEZI|nr:hypothetical protein B0T25DRAFT_294697 [Lasiosphaeria hispida]